MTYNGKKRKDTSEEVSWRLSRLNSYMSRRKGSYNRLRSVFRRDIFVSLQRVNFWFKVDSLNFFLQKVTWLLEYLCVTLRQPASRRPPFAFLSVEEKSKTLRMPESRQVFEVAAAQTSKLVNLVLSSQTAFSIASILLLITNGHNWARWTRRTAIRPGFENVFQQQAADAAYSQQRSYSIQTESFSSTPKPNKWRKDPLAGRRFNNSK